MKVRGIPFCGKNQNGDFVWMRDQPEFSNSLLVYNDNFLDSLITTENTGSGSAIIRDTSWRFSSHPRAAGIPTGWSSASGGFQDMNKFTELALDAALDRIRVILKQESDVSLIHI